MTKQLNGGRRVNEEEMREWSRLVDVSNGERPKPSKAPTNLSLCRSAKPTEIADWERWLECGDVHRSDDADGGSQPHAAKAMTTRLAQKVKPVARQVPEPRILRRLNGGKMSPERRIDLHGMTIREARQALAQFFAAVVRGESKLVLVITGKGTRRYDSDAGYGVLRRMLPEWLTHGPYTDCVWHYCHAHPRHGGNGAYYVLLRPPKSRATGRLHRG